jgi:hypothetical protein
LKKAILKELGQLFVEFHFEHHNPSKEYVNWLRIQRAKDTGKCSLFEFYAEKVMVLIEKAQKDVNPQKLPIPELEKQLARLIRASTRILREANELAVEINRRKNLPD